MELCIEFWQLVFGCLVTLMVEACKSARIQIVLWSSPNLTSVS